MSDTETPVTETQAETILAEAVTTPETDAEPTTEETDWQAEAVKWKALSRQNEAQAKANADKARQYDAIEEANKTELQKAQDALAAAQQAAEEANLRAIRADVARTTGVPPELLTGTDEESLTAAAQKLLEFARTQAPAGARAGGADINGGAAKPTIYRAEQLADPAFFQAHRADILKAQVEGRIIP